MKKLFLTCFIVSLGFISLTTEARDNYVSGHYRKNGSYVKPHFRTSKNYTKRDNYSTRGNINPYTGKRGTKRPY